MTDSGSYSIPIEQTLERLRATNLDDLEQRTLAALDPAANAALLPCMNSRLRVGLETGVVSYESGDRAPKSVTILALHYLLLARDIPPGGRWAVYRELPDGHVFAKPFQERAVEPLALAFGDDPESLRRAALEHGGRPSDLAPFAFVLPFFPRIPVLVMLWPGDDEMPHGANIMFDSRVTFQTDIEDVAVLGETAVYQLARHADRLDVRGLGTLYDYD